MAFYVLNCTVSTPTWDSGKNKWKWVVTPDYSTLHTPPYTYACAIISITPFGDGEAGFESDPNYADVDLSTFPPGPYTFWLNPRTPTWPAVGIDIGPKAWNAIEDIWDSPEYSLHSPCVETQITFGEPVWNVTTSKFDIIATATPYGGIGPYSYSWAGGGSESTITISLDRGETVNVTCTITDEGGGDCVDADTESVTAPDSCISEVELSKSLKLVDGVWFCTVSAIPVGGLEPYSYEWSGVEATAGGGETDASVTFEIDPIDGNTVSVTVTDSTVPTPCEASGDIEVTPVNVEEEVPFGWYCIDGGAGGGGCGYRAAVLVVEQVLGQVRVRAADQVFLRKEVVAAVRALERGVALERVQVAVFLFRCRGRRMLAVRGWVSNTAMSNSI